VPFLLSAPCCHATAPIWSLCNFPVSPLLGNIPAGDNNIFPDGDGLGLGDGDGLGLGLGDGDGLGLGLGDGDGLGYNEVDNEVDSDLLWLGESLKLADIALDNDDTLLGDIPLDTREEMALDTFGEANRDASLLGDNPKPLEIATETDASSYDGILIYSEGVLGKAFAGTDTTLPLDVIPTA